MTLLYALLTYMRLPLRDFPCAPCLASHPTSSLVLTSRPANALDHELQKRQHSAASRPLTTQNALAFPQSLRRVGAPTVISRHTEARIGGDPDSLEPDSALTDSTELQLLHTAVNNSLGCSRSSPSVVTAIVRIRPHRTVRPDSLTSPRHPQSRTKTLRSHICVHA